VARRIHGGMQHVTDLKPHERDTFKAAEALLRTTGIPLLANVPTSTRSSDRSAVTGSSRLQDRTPSRGYRVP
jgi:hypothetical protein